MLKDINLAYSDRSGPVDFLAFIMTVVVEFSGCSEK